jgi:hypothetical protein
MHRSRCCDGGGGGRGRVWCGSVRLEAAIFGCGRVVVLMQQQSELHWAVRIAGGTNNTCRWHKRIATGLDQAHSILWRYRAREQASAWALEWFWARNTALRTLCIAAEHANTALCVQERASSCTYVSALTVVAQACWCGVADESLCAASTTSVSTNVSCNMRAVSQRWRLDSAAPDARCDPTQRVYT